MCFVSCFVAKGSRLAKGRETRAFAFEGVVSPVVYVAISVESVASRRIDVTQASWAIRAWVHAVRVLYVVLPAVGATFGRGE